MLAVFSKLRHHGFRYLLGVVVARSGLTRTVKNVLDLCFDIRHGTRTYGIVRLESLTIESERRREGQFYVATPRYEFNHVMGKLGINPARYVFIDQGCGMGRVLLYAAEAGCRRVIGIELSTELAEIARQNILRLRQHERNGAEMEIVIGDAGELAVPLQPCIIYFFNPFSAAVTAASLAKIKESYEAGNQDIYIIWYNVTANAEPLFRAEWLELLSDSARESARNPFLMASNLRLPYAIFKPAGSLREAGGRHRCGDGEHE